MSQPKARDPGGAVAAEHGESERQPHHHPHTHHHHHAHNPHPHRHHDVKPSSPSKPLTRSATTSAKNQAVRNVRSQDLSHSTLRKHASTGQLREGSSSSPSKPHADVSKRTGARAHHQRDDAESGSADTTIPTPPKSPLPSDTQGPAEAAPPKQKPAKRPHDHQLHLASTAASKARAAAVASGREGYDGSWGPRTASPARTHGEGSRKTDSGRGGHGQRHGKSWEQRQHEDPAEIRKPPPHPNGNHNPDSKPPRRTGYGRTQPHTPHHPSATSSSGPLSMSRTSSNASTSSAPAKPHPPIATARVSASPHRVPATASPRVANASPLRTGAGSPSSAHSKPSPAAARRAASPQRNRSPAVGRATKQIQGEAAKSREGSPARAVHVAGREGTANATRGRGTAPRGRPNRVGGAASATQSETSRERKNKNAGAGKPPTPSVVPVPVVQPPEVPNGAEVSEAVAAAAEASDVHRAPTPGSPIPLDGASMLMPPSAYAGEGGRRRSRRATRSSVGSQITIPEEEEEEDSVAQSLPQGAPSTAVDDAGRRGSGKGGRRRSKRAGSASPLTVGTTGIPPAEGGDEFQLTRLRRTPLQTHFPGPLPVTTTVAGGAPGQPRRSWGPHDAAAGDQAAGFVSFATLTTPPPMSAGSTVSMVPSFDAPTEDEGVGMLSTTSQAGGHSPSGDRSAGRRSPHVSPAALYPAHGGAGQRKGVNGHMTSPPKGAAAPRQLRIVTNAPGSNLAGSIASAGPAGPVRNLRLDMSFGGGGASQFDGPRSAGLLGHGGYFDGHAAVGRGMGAAAASSPWREGRSSSTSSLAAAAAMAAAAATAGTPTSLFPPSRLSVSLPSITEDCGDPAAVAAVLDAVSTDTGYFGHVPHPHGLGYPQVPMPVPMHPSGQAPMASSPPRGWPAPAVPAAHATWPGGAAMPGSPLVGSMPAPPSGPFSRHVVLSENAEDEDSIVPVVAGERDPLARGEKGSASKPVKAGVVPAVHHHPAARGSREEVGVGAAANGGFSLYRTSTSSTASSSSATTVSSVSTGSMSPPRLGGAAAASRFGPLPEEDGDAIVGGVRGPAGGPSGSSPLLGGPVGKLTKMGPGTKGGNQRLSGSSVTSSATNGSSVGTAASLESPPSTPAVAPAAGPAVVASMGTGPGSASPKSHASASPVAAASSTSKLASQARQGVGSPVPPMASGIPKSVPFKLGASAPTAALAASSPLPPPSPTPSYGSSMYSRPPTRSATETPHSTMSSQYRPPSPEVPGADQLPRGPFRLEDFEFVRTIGTGSFGRVHLVRYRPASVCDGSCGAPPRLSSSSVIVRPNGIYQKKPDAEAGGAGCTCAERLVHLPNRGKAVTLALKVLRKTDVVRLRQVEHTIGEKKIQERLHHPFLVSLLGTFQDAQHVYLVLEYVRGGELFSLLRRVGRVSDGLAKYYAAQVVLALEYLHSRDIVYRDLKPENLLIDSRGHLRITDFGFAKVVKAHTWTLCGTPDYLAPEIIQSKGYGKAVDWWALGILIYEMIAGHPPFFDDDHFKLYEKILACRPRFPPNFDPHAKDLVRRLLTPDLSRRYGNLKNGAADIRSHPWFEGIDWDAMLRLEIEPPYLPPSSKPSVCDAARRSSEDDDVADAQNFDMYEEDWGPYGEDGPDGFGDKFADF
ncbi:serine/threonine protein kinase, AGC [Phlyctochytrium bullatum]|nr:serine/threonine protein kinase, AGC [Phlyctochytrium bullatum]